MVGSRLLWRFKWSCALALGLMALLGGCSTSNDIIYGTPVISMGDVSGDFTSYIIAIDEITFTRNDGLVVEPLSTPETVDLAKLTNLSELVEAPAFPYGTYTSMTLILDYTAPNITIDVGGGVKTVSPLDTTGEPMITTSVTVDFDPDHPLVIAPNQSTAFTIDIDLAAMNTVNTSASPPTATVQPFLSGSVIPVTEMGPLRARGLVVIAQPASSDFIVNIRPFADLVSALGALTVDISPTTYFNINGTVYVGAAGLNAMTATNITNTPAVAYGTVDNISGITPSFNATSVYVGTSEETLIADFLTGTVRYVNGGTLQIEGVSYLNRYGELYYYGEIPVTVGPDTQIYEDGVATTGLKQASISVGQQVTVGGQAVTNTTTGELESLDATPQDGFTGLVRLQSTQLWGTLNSATTGSISLDLLSINNFEPTDFFFTGTGSTAANDAVASSYRVDTGTLNESTLPAGTQLQVNGLVTPFGTAPPDFTASSVVPASAVQSVMVYEFNAGVLRPFATLIPLAVDLASTDSVHYIQTGPSKIDITTLPQAPAITFAPGITPILAIGSDDVAINVYNEPSSFIKQVDILQNEGNTDFYRLVCVGQYDAATNTFVATRVDLAEQETPTT
jgi:Domain of unknown function (DUF4382)